LPEFNGRTFKINALFELSDSEYVIRLQNGEVQAFDALYNRHHRAVYANIFKLVKEATASQDILQEVFIALWEHRLSIDADQSVAGWLFVVSYNKSIAYLKRALRQAIVRSELGNEVYPDENEVTLRERQVQLLEEAVQQLSPQKRKVLELCKFQGRTYEEVAQELNISKHTVKEYLSLAIGNIKEYIKNHPENMILLFTHILLFYMFFCVVFPCVTFL
jgi:RNA polymerase sigma factor (sigma-70 family)